LTQKYTRNRALRKRGLEFTRENSLNPGNGRSYAGREEQAKDVPYVIGYGMRNKREVSTAEKPTAKEA
jgi:hypothetical protein